MKYAHLIKLTVFSYEDEDKEAILDAYLRLFPFNLEENKIELKKKEAAGFNERKILVIEAKLTKDSFINLFLKKLIENLEEIQKQRILQQIASRLDKDMNFFLRFDKHSWLNEKKLVLTDSGKCFHMKMSVAAFPKRREIALNALKELFSEQLNLNKI
ncbi:hypothetical protein HYY70_03205 [Candidatus Woesearchaeota archaeon]|nr:hypothetical protein [Candidatus Woesearchaeota archaeon]